MKSASNKTQYDPEKVLNKILQVETLFPVNEWKINGIEFWPFIRTSLAYTQRDWPKKNKKSKSSAYTKLIGTYGKVILLLPFMIFALKRKLRSSTRVFIGAVTHRVSIKGMKVNKYFDAAIGDFNKRGESAIILDRGTSLKKSEYPNKESWFSLPVVYVLREMLNRAGISKSANHKFELDHYDQFYAYLLENFENTSLLKSSFEESVIKKKMVNFYERKELLKSFLKKSKIEHVYFLCYYSSLFYPLIAACNELGMNTTDVQHGGMGPGHFSYDRWTRIPEKGYTLLPRYFWTWDENSCKLINNWALTTRFHEAFNKGTPWVEDLSRVSGYVPLQSDYILYNMTDAILEPYAVETIRHFGSQKTWVLRMHPRQMAKRQMLQNQLEQSGIQDFVSIEDSTRVLLSDSLRFCSMFISDSSGSVIEAMAMGLTPLLLPSPGFNYYVDYVKSGQVIALAERNEKNLIELIKSLPPHQYRNKAVTGGATNSTTGFKDFENVIARK